MGDEQDQQLLRRDQHPQDLWQGHSEELRAVVQRVSRAHVAVGGEVVGDIGAGLVVFVCTHRDDTESEAIKLADKVIGLRIFNDEAGKLNLALADATAEEVLVISNFTLYGDTRKSRRPSFTESAGAELGEALYDRFCHECAVRGARVSRGQFGAMMHVVVENDGPVTLIVEVPPASMSN